MPAPPDKPGWKDGKPIRDEDLDKLKTSTPLSTRVRPSANYPYDDADHKPYMRVQRLDFGDGRKSYPQSAFVNGEWTSGLPKDFERILYRLPDLLKSRDALVLVCEGEKSADLARRLGFTATTASGGAGNAHKTRDWTPLADKDVVIIRDNDEAGMAHARQVAGLLIGIARSIRIITMPDVAEKGDLVDWVEAGGDADGLRELIEATPAFGLPVPPPPPPTLSRVFAERAFVCNAWDHLPTANVLASFRSKQFKDPAARAGAQAIKRILKNNSELEPLAVGAEMGRTGHFELWLQLEKFSNERLQHLGMARASTYKAFREHCSWDSGLAFVRDAEESHGRGSFQDWIATRQEGVAELLAHASTTELKTLKTHVEEWLDELIAGRKSEGLFNLALLAPIIGESGGGDVIVGIAPPKTGKTTFVGKLMTDLANENVKSLYGQLEMRMDQVVKREVAKLLQKPVKDVTEADARELRKSGKLSHLANIYMTKRCTTLSSYRAEVSSILAKNPDIKFWVTDYAECLQRFGDGANRVDESEAIAKMIKETAIAFNVCAFLLVQPTKEYSKEGAAGPKPYHAKNSGKWEQDAQAMIFLQSPARFFADMPKEYLEVHVMASRDSDTGVIPLRWNPATFDYELWKGPVPAGGGRPLKQQTETQRYALDQVEMEDIPL
jgi:replicative DNA helicase